MEGSYKDLGNTDGIYAQLLTQEQEQTKEEKEIMINAAKTMRQQSVRVSTYEATKTTFQVETQINIINPFQSKSNSITSTLSESASSIMDSVDKTDPDKQDFEESSKGKVQGNLMYQYMVGGGNIFFAFIVIILYLLSQTAASGADYWVSYW